MSTLDQLRRVLSFAVQFEIPVAGQAYPVKVERDGDRWRLAHLPNIKTRSGLGLDPRTLNTYASPEDAIAAIADLMDAPRTP